MISRILYTILLSLAAVLFSCSGSGVTTGEQPESSSMFLSVTLGELTRATEDGEDALNENTIYSIDVLIFEEDSLRCTFYQHFDLASPSIGTGSTTEELNTIQSQFRYGVNYDTFVVANYTGTELQRLGKNIDRGTLTSLVESGLDPDAVQSSFLMDGVYTMVLNDGVQKNKTIPVKLKRAASKIRVQIVYDQTKYTVPAGTTVEKMLMNYTPSGFVVASGGLLTFNQESMQVFTPFENGAGGNGKAIMYSYENNWVADQQAATYLILNIPVEDAQGVHTDNYYRVPVNYRYSNDGSHDVYKLQRNYLYDITVHVNALGSDNPGTAEPISSSYTIMDWTTKQVEVSVEGAEFIYVKDTNINLPNRTSFTTTFQSSTPDVTITNIQVNGVPINNGDNGVALSITPNAKSGEVTINSALPTNFFAKVITFTVQNGVPLAVNVTVTQYPAVYLTSHDSADIPAGGQGQTNDKMYILGSFVADFSTFPIPDEFDEAFPAGYYHWAPDPALGRSYADYIRTSAVLGYPLTDANGATIDTDENNRRVSPRFMLASQYGTTTAMTYTNAVRHCEDYVEEDKTTGLTYYDWRIPTLAEVYMIDILQNVAASEVKRILEGSYYWSSRASSSVKFMDPRVGNSGSFGPMYTSVRCVRDVKE